MYNYYHLYTSNTQFSAYCDEPYLATPINGKFTPQTYTGGWDNWRNREGIFYNVTPLHPHTTNIVYPGETHAGISAFSIVMVVILKGLLVYFLLYMVVSTMKNITHIHIKVYTTL